LCASQRGEAALFPPAQNVFIGAIPVRGVFAAGGGAMLAKPASGIVLTGWRGERRAAVVLHSPRVLALWVIHFASQRGEAAFPPPHGN
jgi:hypothetical protein